MCLAYVFEHISSQYTIKVMYIHAKLVNMNVPFCRVYRTYTIFALEFNISILFYFFFFLVHVAVCDVLFLFSLSQRIEQKPIKFYAHFCWAFFFVLILSRNDVLWLSLKINWIHSKWAKNIWKKIVESSNVKNQYGNTIFEHFFQVCILFFVLIHKFIFFYLTSLSNAIEA